MVDPGVDPEEITGDADADPVDAGSPDKGGEYQNDGEWSPFAAQSYLPKGDPNPTDGRGNPIVWYGTVMSDPQPVADEFAKQWANPEGGKEAWLARLRPLITDDAYAGFSYTGEENILPLKLIKVTIVKDPGHLASGFYRFIGTYEGCGDVILSTITPQPEGSWLVDTTTEAQESSPATRGNGCFS